jgi:uncharacterized protein YgiM (DUF1202 family)
MKSLMTMLVLSCIALTASAETAVTTRNTELQAKAQSDAATLATLPANTSVEVVGRQGGWSQVKASGKDGWIRLLHLKFNSSGAASGSGSSDPLAGLNNLLSSGRTSNSATTTQGIKGLTAEKVKDANPDPAEFKKMQGYAVSKSVAQSFSHKNKLASAKVEYLANPAPVRGESTSVQGG